MEIQNVIRFDDTIKISHLPLRPFDEISGNAHQIRYGTNRFATMINQAHGSSLRRRNLSTKKKGGKETVSAATEKKA